jgi:luciferase family oxidoreductase group 1
MSILDLAPIVEGGDARGALRNALELGRHGERLGYRRIWFAEHHGMSGVASAATSVVIAHVAGGTSTIRVGAGGIMLPNHAPLVIAEQFGTLACLFPGRIDLGVGRAPGTDPATARALRRGRPDGVDRFPDDVVELMGYLRPTRPGQALQAIPGAGTNVPIWILGSSLYGAQLAAALGLPFAFASHFAPAHMTQALAIYRAQFRPSGALDAPHAMLGVNVIAAETDDEARRLFTSLRQTFLQLRRGRPGPLSPPARDVAAFEAQLGPDERAMLDETFACAFVGSAHTVRAGLARFIERTRADELMVSGHIFDHGARLRSFEMLGEIAPELTGAGVTQIPAEEPVSPGSAAFVA